MRGYCGPKPRARAPGQVNVLEPSITVTDVLSRWGLRELRKYPVIQMPSDQAQRAALGMEVVLRHVPALVARILLAEPLDPDKPGGAFRADFESADSTKLVLHTGVRLASVDVFGNAHVQQLVKIPDAAPIVCTIRVAGDDTTNVIEPFVIYDGWHRAAAWLISIREGRPYPLTAEIIKTRLSSAPSAS